MLEDLGLSHEKLEANGALEKMLSWQKSDLLPIAVPYGNSSIYTEARIAFRTDDDGNIGLAVHALRKEPQLDFPYNEIFRRYLMEQSRLISAIRLPSGMFSEHAGTEVGSDLIVLQKQTGKGTSQQSLSKNIA